MITARSMTAWCLAAAVMACTSGCTEPVSREERLREGTRLFEEQGCIVCHGREGRGDGTRSAALNPPPRDFRELTAYLQGTDARAIASTLQTGIRVHYAQMPTFAHLSERERLALGEFIVSLQQRQGQPIRAK